ncbi:MAG: glycosyltransferase [Gemmatimonadetes bacterium]|nr:glycosyltransferase [Gemmatimonadota bacterium]
MKVGLIIPGGVDRSGEFRVIPCLLWLIERVAARAELHVFALHQEPHPTAYALLGATVHNIGGRARRARTVRAVVREHRRGPFDLLHAVWVDQGLIAAAAGWLLRRRVLLHLTGGDLAGIPEVGFGLLRSRRGRMKLRWATRAAGRVTVPSEFMRAAAAAMGIAADCVPFGVALDRWPARPPRPRSPGAAASLLHVGSLNRIKDHLTLLRAARALKEAGLAFRLDLVGADTLGGEIQRFASSCGLDDRVRFCGFLPHRALRPLVEQADLLLVSSRHEADPIAMLEAAVAGVPTVGTAVGHIHDWAPDAAVAVPVEDWRALARGALALLADEPRRLEIATAAQARAVRLDADWTATRVMGLYHALAGGTTT